MNVGQKSRLSISIQKKMYEISSKKHLYALLGVVSVFTLIITTFHLFDNGLHLIDLLLPLGLCHLLFGIEQGGVWTSVTSAESVPESGELAVVVVEIQMMICMAGGTIDCWVIGDILSVIWNG